MAGSTTRVVEPSASARAYRELLRRIVTLEIRPGQALDEDVLAADIGVGIASIRQAVTRLSAEGLVRVYPRRATIAEDVGLNDVRFIWELRGPLEETAARYAAQRLDAAGEARLTDLRAKLQGFDPATPAEVLDLHHDIHASIAQCTRNPHLIDALSRLLNLTMRCWHLMHEAGALRDHDLRPHHEPIIDAILQRNPEAAVLASRKHLSITFDSYPGGNFHGLDRP